MAFTQPCFLRKNSAKLREYLRSIGYNTITNDKIDSLDEGLLAVNGNPDIVDSYPNYSSWDNDFFDKYFSNREDIIDCGTNEELFKAFSALNDETDYMQWFTDGVKWHLCKFNDIKTEYCMGDTPFAKQNFHKATVKELIEHFK